VEDSKWLRLKGAGDEIKEQMRLNRYERDLFSLENYDFKSVRNLKMEYKSEIPMDFNMQNIREHKRIL
jgi:hypothetical protein